MTKWSSDPDQTLPFRSATMNGWSGWGYADLKDEAAKTGLLRLMVAWGKFD